VKDQIVLHAAKAFFGCAWADMQEYAIEGGENLSGCEILDVAPITDPSAVLYAESLVEQTEKDNGKTITEILDYCASDSGGCDRECNPEMFGHYLAMHAMGSGVGLESVTNRECHRHSDLDIKVPYAEDYCCYSFTETPILEQDHS
jgi:hypothetical protein